MFGFFKKNRQPRGLQGGDLSVVSQAACDHDYVQKCFESADGQQAKFATLLCLLFYRCSEILVKRIEEDNELLQFYAGTPRDVLLYESFLFYQNLITGMTKDTLDGDHKKSFDHYSTLAAHAGISLAKGKLGDFDAKSHRERRLKPLFRCRGDPMQMTETFCGVLLCLAGKRHVSDPDAKLSLDLTISLKVRQVATCHIKYSRWRSPREHSGVLQTLLWLGGVWGRRLESGGVETEKLIAFGLDAPRVGVARALSVTPTESSPWPGGRSVARAPWPRPPRTASFACPSACATQTRYT